MPTPVLTTEAVERSTFVVRVDFKDRNGTAVTPTSLTWTLTDENGSVVNNRRDVSATAVAGSATITLSGADLAIDGTERVRRILSVSGTVSAAPVKEEVVFFIRPLVGADRTLVVAPVDMALSLDSPAVAEDA